MPWPLENAVIQRSEATKDRFRAKAVEVPWMESDPSLATLAQDDEQGLLRNDCPRLNDLHQGSDRRLELLILPLRDDAVLVRHLDVRLRLLIL
jgi:hypothetical protein